MWKNPHIQFVDPDTLLLIWKDHYVHLRGRDGHPGERGYKDAVKIIKKLDDLKVIEPLRKSTAANSLDSVETPQVFLNGIWYDCKNPNIKVYLVTEPKASTPYANPADISDIIYSSILKQAKDAMNVIEACEPGQNIHGYVAEFWYTGGADYEHHINKFFGRSGLLRGLAEFENGVMNEFQSTEHISSHPDNINVSIYSFEDFDELMKDPPRGRFGIGDALHWKMITPEQLRKLIKK